MKISIFGVGYVGLVTGTCLAELGHEVMCMDVDANKIERLKKFDLPIYEPGLQELVERNSKNGRLQFTSQAEDAISFSTCLFNCVGTPTSDQPDSSADLTYVYSVAKKVGEIATEYKLLINKSTVPVQTGHNCLEIMSNELEKRDLDVTVEVASNPEFLREGAAVKDFLNPDRIVCGVESEQAKKLLQEVYGPLSRSYSQVLFTDIKSAEIIKYASNAFLATKISFINEIANFTEKVGGNISDISRGIGADKRIGSKFLHAGIGYGGSCFPKDVKALIASGKQAGYNFKIVDATEKVNQQQKLWPIRCLEKKQVDFTELKVGILGVSFKPRTNDTRDAASRTIIAELLNRGVSRIKLYDPIALDEFFHSFGPAEHLVRCENMYESATGVDVLMVLTERDEFRSVDYTHLKNSMDGNIIIDGRNIWDKDECKKRGFDYWGVGLKK